MIGLQIRIEYDNLMIMGDHLYNVIIKKCISDPDHQELLSKQKLMRRVVSVGLAIVFIKFVLWPNLPNLFVLGTLFGFTIRTAALYIGIPILFIISHDNMKTHAIKKIKKKYVAKTRTMWMLK
jgi:hypothetical protein